MLARRVFADGRTRAYAWGRAVAREDLAAATERLIAMSGQFEQRRLARPAYQLDVLDAFFGGRRPRGAAMPATPGGAGAARRRSRGDRAGRRRRGRPPRGVRELVERTDGFGAGKTAATPGATACRRGGRADGGRRRRGRLAPDEGDGASRSGRRAGTIAPLGLAPELEAPKRSPRAAVGMGEGEFRVELREREPGPTGRDEVAFLIRPNPGMPFGPVAETASGGELSRVALALAVLAGGRRSSSTRSTPASAASPPTGWPRR